MGANYLVVEAEHGFVECSSLALSKDQHSGTGDTYKNMWEYLHPYCLDWTGLPNIRSKHIENEIQFISPDWSLGCNKSRV